MNGLRYWLSIDSILSFSPRTPIIPIFRSSLFRSLSVAFSAALSDANTDVKRNVLEASADAGSLGGRFFDEDSGREIVYRVKRLPLGMFASLLAVGFPAAEEKPPIFRR